MNKKDPFKYMDSSCYINGWDISEDKSTFLAELLFPFYFSAPKDNTKILQLFIRSVSVPASIAHEQRHLILEKAYKDYLRNVKKQLKSKHLDDGEEIDKVYPYVEGFENSQDGYDFYGLIRDQKLRKYLPKKDK